MLTTVTHSKINKIIESAGNNLRVIVNAMNNDPPHPPASVSADDFESRFESIKDLNIISAMGEDHLETSPEFEDRYPFAAFFIDEVARDGDDTHYKASLGLRIEVQGETFAIAQREIHEILNACRSVVLMDKSFGEYGARGGIVDTTRYAGYADASFLVNDLDEHIIGLTAYFETWFSEQVIR